MLFRLKKHSLQAPPIIEVNAAGIESPDIICSLMIETIIDGAPTKGVGLELEYKFVQMDFVTIKIPKTLTAEQIKAELKIKAKEFIIANYGQIAP